MSRQWLLALLAVATLAGNAERLVRTLLHSGGFGETAPPFGLGTSGDAGGDGLPIRPWQNEQTDSRTPRTGRCGGKGFTAAVTAWPHGPPSRASHAPLGWRGSPNSRTHALPTPNFHPYAPATDRLRLGWIFRLTAWRTPW